MYTTKITNSIAQSEFSIFHKQILWEAINKLCKDCIICYESIWAM